VLSQKISFKNKRVLVAPLDWGLGHTARCIPILKLLLEQNNRVTVACTERQKAFLLNEISGLEFVDLFGYDVRYSKVFPLWMMLMFQFIRLSLVIKKENKWLENYLKGHETDVVISDNRFGFYNKEVESIFITHQVFIKAPFLNGWLNSINHKFISKFNQCWIADLEETDLSLAGELSHGKELSENACYIGPLSRFTKKELLPSKTIDVLILLSGVEPQRTLLEEKLTAALRNSKLNIVLVRGTEMRSAKTYAENILVKNIAITEELQELFYSSRNIICRSGYSTLMDLHTLGLKAILIPTPGQTEQEYLADHWKEKFRFKILQQKKISEEAVLNLINTA
jgi:predicted glycosyltransferase